MKSIDGLKIHAKQNLINKKESLKMANLISVCTYGEERQLFKLQTERRS